MPRIDSHPNWPSSTEILSDLGFYAAYRDSGPTMSHRANEHEKGYRSNCIMCRGAWVDIACRLFAEGKPLSLASLSDANRLGWDGYFESFRKAWLLYDWKLIEAQGEVINNRLRYVGHYDLRVEGSASDDTALLEIKAGVLLEPAINYQTASYADEPDRRFGVSLKQDGSVAVVKPYNDRRDFDRWAIYVRAWWQLKEDGILT